MKSQIQANKKNSVLTVTKKLVMLVALVLGTSVMVNAQTPAKTMETKEVKTVKHHKKDKAGKKMDVTKTEMKTEAKTVKTNAKK